MIELLISDKGSLGIHWGTNMLSHELGVEYKWKKRRKEKEKWREKVGVDLAWERSEVVENGSESTAEWRHDGNRAKRRPSFEMVNTAACLTLLAW